MSRKWYVKKGQDTFGPFSGAEFKSQANRGELLRSDLVRCDDAAEWVPAARVKGLFKFDGHRNKGADETCQTTRDVQVAPVAPREVVPAVVEPQLVTVPSDNVIANNICDRPCEWQRISEMAGGYPVLQDPQYVAATKQQQYLMAQHAAHKESSVPTYNILAGSVGLSAALICTIRALYFASSRAMVALSSTAALLAAAFVVFCFVTIIRWNKMASKTRVALMNAYDSVKAIYGDLVRRRWEAMFSAVVQRMPRSASLRNKEFSELFGVFYTPEFFVLIDIENDRYLTVPTALCRESTIHHRQVGSETVGATQSNAGCALAGAVVGNLLFGGVGAITGAVIGASSGRESVSQSVHEYAWTVDVFTTSERLPTITFDYSQDERGAKMFYGTINAHKHRDTAH